jgi:hypothetical protein
MNSPPYIPPLYFVKRGNLFITNYLLPFCASGIAYFFPLKFLLSISLTHLNPTVEFLSNPGET